MSLRLFLRLIVGLALLVIIIVGLTSINHPIILKWLTGSARLVGRPESAIVFTDGHMNRAINIYHVDHYWNGKPADYFILHFPYAKHSHVEFISLNKKDRYAGLPSSTN